MDDLPNAVVIAIFASIIAGLIGPVVRFVLRRLGRDQFADDLARIRWPVRLTAIASVGVVAGVTTDTDWAETAGTAALVVASSWLLVRVGWVVQELMFRRLHIDVADNLRARSRRTQVELVRRLASTVIVLLAIVVLLVRVLPIGSLGPSLVAYAGLIGVVLGIALRAPLENLAAGIAVAVTEPIRMDDVVVIEGEWGRIEDIGLLNVVVRIWDERRLVLPTSRFVNEPFENWTRRSSQVMGSVTLWVDYSTDIAALRAETEAALARLPRFDGRAQVVQVVELGSHAVQVRILCTARDAQDLWDLRCDLREKLLTHLQARSDELPVVRIDGPSPRPAGE